MDAYENMDHKDVRYLCKLFGIHHSTFYRLKKQYNRYNLASLKYRSRKPKKLTTINWSVVTEVCEWKKDNPRKSQYYLYQEWIRANRVPPCSPKTIYNWWKRRNLIVLVTSYGPFGIMAKYSFFFNFLEMCITHYSTFNKIVSQHWIFIYLYAPLINSFKMLKSFIPIDLT